MLVEHIGAVADQRLDAACRHVGPEIGIKGFTDLRAMVDLEIARMDHAAFGRVDHKSRAFWDRMRDRQEPHGERSRGDGLGPFRHGGDHLVGIAIFRQFAARDIRSEGAGIDFGLAQTLEQMPDRTDMVLMCVGNENCLDLRFALFQPCDIGKDQIHAGRSVHIGKGHADIDDDQAFLVLGAISVDIAIHTNLPGTAEGKVDQSVTAHKLS